MQNKIHSISKAGLFYGLACFITWGMLPLYWKHFHFIPSSILLCHRIVWSMLTFIFFSALLGNWRMFKNANWKSVFFAPAISGCFIGINWLIYIYAVNANHILEASMGYFIAPLVNVLFGFLFLGEKLKKIQILALTLAIFGVVFFQAVLPNAHFPWLGITLSITICAYALVKKKFPMNALNAATIEAILLSIPALIYLSQHGSLETYHLSRLNLIFLACSGVVTGLPLIWYAKTTQMLKLTTVGFIQFINPTLQFSIATIIYNEEFRSTQAAGFAFIWAGVALYCVSLLKN